MRIRGDMMTNSDPFSLNGKNIIITGASSGIGKACAIRCSERGAKVMIVGRNYGRLLETKTLLTGEGHIEIAADISHTDTICSIVQEANKTFGTIDGLIHSAGVSYHKPLHVMKRVDYDDTFSVNVLAAFELCKQISKKGFYQEGASLVLIASVMASVGAILKVGYCSSKGALVSGMKAMALELARKNIRVNTVSPGVIETEMVKRNYSKADDSALNNVLMNQVIGIGHPDDVAYACIYLLSDASRFITGTDLVVDGGYTAQ
jgi:NAD(P)-dependent dehydrogenase (short-subunit alcohol dehydrogenase family)